jgi:hypothetical protein
MAILGRIGHGAKLSRGDVATPTNFVEILGATNIQGLYPELDTLEATEMHQTDFRKRYIPGMIDLNPVTAQVNFKVEDTTTKNLRADILARAARYFRITYPNGSTVDFTAFVVSLPHEIPNQSTMTGTLTLRPDGENLTFTDA